MLVNNNLKKIQGLSLLELLATDHLTTKQNQASDNLLLSKASLN